MSFLTNILSFAQKRVTHDVAAKYLHSRGVSDTQVRDVGIGYIPEGEWPPFVTASDDADVTAYLRWSSKGSRLKGKLLIPVKNTIGQVVGFQTRTPSAGVKDYSKFYLRRAKVDATFMGLDSAMPYIWDKRGIVLCEGTFDYFPLQRVLPNTVCTGTANLSHRQIEFLTRFVDDVTVVFDDDEGADTFWSAFEKNYSSKFLSLRRIKLRGGKDVSDVWSKLGDDGLKAAIDKSVLTLF